MEQVVVAWIGGADIDKGLCNETGPIDSTLKKYADKFSAAYFLYNYKDKDVKGYLDWLKNSHPLPINDQFVGLTSPQDFGEIYKAADKLLSDIQEKHPKAAITLQITPGTPAMQAVWILLGKTKYSSVQYLQSSAEQGVYETSIPFEISAEFQSGRLQGLAHSNVPSHAAFDDIITQNKHMQELKQRATVLAQHDVPVLITGASGTGKELFATAIHNASSLSEKEMQVVNCGAIPPELIDSTLFGHKKGAFTGAASDQQGVFEAANGSSLFLDEFGELPLEAQVRLLRVLQEGKITRVGETKPRDVNVRIICATNKDLAKAIAEGDFREDLFYRVAVGTIQLPPISERKGDLSLLAKTLLKSICQQLNIEDKKISPKANNLILSHDWPGNVRELNSTLLRASLWSQSKSISEADLINSMFTQSSDSSDIMSHDLSQPIDLKELTGRLEEHYVRLAWQKTAGQKKKAAELLGMKNYQNFDKRLKDYGIK